MEIAQLHRFRLVVLVLAGLLSLASGSENRAFADGAEDAPRKIKPPPTLLGGVDPLWVQVSKCIQYALKANLLARDLDFTKAPAAPCAYVDSPTGINSLIGAGYTIVKDISAKKTAAFLALPSKIVTGIEDPQVYYFAGPSSNSTYSHNYWSDAWGLRKYVRVASGKTLTDLQLGLAINSVAARTINQLHIHMACLRKDVRLAIAGKATANWSAKPIVMPPAPGQTTGHSYYLILLASLINQNPFLVMHSAPLFKDPGLVTMVVAGAPNNRFYLLLDYTTATDRGFGEELLDQSCTDP